MIRFLRSHCAVLVVLLSVLVSSPLSGLDVQPVHAQAASADDKGAFEAAKELGTAEAWNAFLRSYPSGFYADMARAYLSKIGQQQQPSDASTSPQLVPSSARAGERRCADRKSLRSERSTEPTKITFVNASGMYRALLWIDFNGNLQDYGGLNPGEQKTLETFRTHPWMIATGPGDCLQIFLPAAEPATVELRRLAADDGPSRYREVAAPKQPKKQSAGAKPLKCATNYHLVKGNCVPSQNCGRNARRNHEGDCQCDKGYRMVNGNCTWPTNKNGFEIAPWKKSGCKSLQAQCNRGNNGACGQYEAKCQVN